MPFLNFLGANARVRALLPSGEGLVLGRVAAASHEQFRILTGDGREREAVPAGRLRWEEELPVVGDWVAARLVDETGSSLALIEQLLLPRVSAIVRKQAGRSQRAQTLAANVDLALVVTGLDGDYRLRRLERYFVVTRQAAVPAIVALNKTDLCEPKLAAQRTAEVLAAAPAGTRVVALAARDSVEVLVPLLAGRTVALLGSSGAGKSTIAAALTQAALATAPVRASDSRGRHTTTQRMLLPLPPGLGGGALVDTPGLRELALWAADDADVDSAFEDIAALAAGCRFVDCSHEAEPGCAVQAALETGALDARRCESWRKLRREAAFHQREADPLAARAHRQKWKAIHKALGRQDRFEGR